MKDCAMLRWDLHKDRYLYVNDYISEESDINITFIMLHLQAMYIVMSKMNRFFFGFL